MVPNGMLMSIWILTGLAICFCCFAVSAACCFLLLLVLLCCFCCLLLLFLVCAPIVLLFFSVVCAAFASVRAAFAAFAVAAVFGPPTVEQPSLAALTFQNVCAAPVVCAAFAAVCAVFCCCFSCLCCCRCCFWCFFCCFCRSFWCFFCSTRPTASNFSCQHHQFGTAARTDQFKLPNPNQA